MRDKKERKRLAILKVLKDAQGPISSTRITSELRAAGLEISERTVRLYFQSLDKDGFTKNFGRRGRAITEEGLRELEDSRIIERVGFLSAKIDQLTYSMDFDLEKRSGTVVVNMSIMEPDQLKHTAHLISRVFAEGFAMGDLLTLFEAGERVGDIEVPKGKLGVGTVCAITLNGVLLKNGISANSRFGGLLEVRNKKPTRFVEIITYEGTSLDPLEMFIRSGLTDYMGAITTGNGRIGASFREFPAASKTSVEDLALRLKEVGLGGFMTIGFPGQPLLEIPGSEGRVGAVVIGGLNPVATLEETGARVYSRALAGLLDYERLFSYKDLESRIQKFTS